jgi:hypothetical protein
VLGIGLTTVQHRKVLCYKIEDSSGGETRNEQIIFIGKSFGRSANVRYEMAQDPVIGFGITLFKHWVRWAIIL